MKKTVYAMGGRGKDFGFNLEVFDNSQLSTARRGRWQITHPSGLGLWGSLLGPPGERKYKPGLLARRDSTFCNVEGPDRLPFVIVWRLAGPGCV